MNIDAINDLEEGVQKQIFFEGRVQDVERVRVENVLDDEDGAISAYAVLADGRWINLITEDWKEVRQ